MNHTSPDVARRKVLVVDEEAASRELLRTHLGLAGFEIDEVGDGALALARACAAKCDAIILDVSLPSLDGLTVCRAIRSTGANVDTPILMLTARDTESDKVLGLESGADDYLTKPFAIRELLARVGAVLRRHHRRRHHQTESAAPRRIFARDLMLDAERREGSVRGEPVVLTRQEFDLLSLLAARPGIVFSRVALLTNVWSGATHVTERTVDTVVSRLRRKIELNAGDPKLILTAWGVGYKFADVD